MPTQIRWVQAYDSDDNRISITKDEFAAAPKCYNADGSYSSKPPAGCPATEPTAQNQTASGSKYALCQQLQAPVGGDSFVDMGSFSDSSSAETAIAIGAVAVLASVGMWTFFRK